VRIHADVLEPLDDLVGSLIKQTARSARSPNISPRSKVHGAASDHGRQPGEAVLLALRSLHATCRHRRARDFPADESKYDNAKIAEWNWDTYLTAAQKLYKAGFPVGLRWAVE